MKRTTALLIAFVMAFALTSFASAQTKTTKTPAKKPAVAAKTKATKKGKKLPVHLKHAVAKTSKTVKPMRSRHGKTATIARKTSKTRIVAKPMKSTHAARKVGSKPTTTKKSSKQVQKK